MTLVAILLPLLPGLINGILAIVHAIANHPDTPENAAAQLADVATQLDSVAAQVATIQIRRTA